MIGIHTYIASFMRLEQNIILSDGRSGLLTNNVARLSIYIRRNNWVDYISDKQYDNNASFLQILRIIDLSQKIEGEKISN